MKQLSSLLLGWFEIVVFFDANGELRFFARLARLAKTFRFSDQTNKEIRMLKLSVIQQSTVSITPLDAKGHTAPVDGAPVWTTSADGIVKLTVAPDGLSAAIVAQSVGTCQVNVTGDADLGAGVKAFTGTLDVQVIAAEAVAFQINAGAVTDQP